MEPLYNPRIPICGSLDTSSGNESVDAWTRVWKMKTKHQKGHSKDKRGKHVRNQVVWGKRAQLTFQTRNGETDSPSIQTNRETPWQGNNKFWAA